MRTLFLLKDEGLKPIIDHIKSPLKLKVTLQTWDKFSEDDLEVGSLDAIIIQSPDSPERQSCVERLMQMNVPCVLFGMSDSKGHQNVGQALSSLIKQRTA